MCFEADGFTDESTEFRLRYFKEHALERIRGLLDPESRFIQFTVNPYRRAVSSYLYAMTLKYLGEQYSDVSFNTFLDGLIGNKVPLDVHNTSQIFFMHKFIKQECFKVEQIDTLLPIINQKYGLNYKWKTAPHHAITSDIESEFLGDTKYSDIKTIPKDYKHFYNDEIKEKVERLYGEDLRVFNYTWDEFLTSSYK